MACPSDTNQRKTILHTSPSAKQPSNTAVSLGFGCVQYFWWHFCTSYTQPLLLLHWQQWTVDELTLQQWAGVLEGTQVWIEGPHWLNRVVLYGSNSYGKVIKSRAQVPPGSYAYGNRIFKKSFPSNLKEILSIYFIKVSIWMKISYINKAKWTATYVTLCHDEYYIVMSLTYKPLGNYPQQVSLSCYCKSRRISKLLTYISLLCSKVEISKVFMILSKPAVWNCSIVLSNVNRKGCSDLILENLPNFHIWYFEKYRF